MSGSARPSENTQSISVGKRAAFTALVLVGLPLAGIVAVEGISSLVLLGRDSMAAIRPVSSDEVRTEYHSQLGWVGKANFAAPDHWGPGMHLHTNSRGLRGRAEVSDARPNAKKRLVCSGDSFTLGVGVGDDHAWCHLLASETLETVNMGQGGYGIDQAYLWYKRDAQAMEHDIHLLSFVTDDFTRMARVSFLGYAKPKLALDGDSLRVEGVPTPRRHRARSTLRLLEALRRLRAYELMGGQTRAANQRAAAAPTRIRAVAGAGAGAETSGTRTIFARVVADLQRVNHTKNSRFALIYMPDATDYANDGAAVWRAQVQTIADSLGVPFIDMVAELRKLSRLDAPALYLRDEDEVALLGAAGHFNVEGNRWAAGIIRARLATLGWLSTAAGPQ